MHTRLFGRLRSSEVAFTVVVIAAYAVLFTTYDFKIYDPRSLVWIVLGAIYLGIGLYGSRLLNDREHRAPWLLPLIGTAVENLSRVWVVIICIVIWLGDGLSIGGHICHGICPGGAALMEGPYAHMADPSRGGASWRSSPGAGC